MRRFFTANVEADRRAIPVEEVLDEYREREDLQRRFDRGELSRRAFIQALGAAGVAAAAAPLFDPVASASAAVPDTGARVVIIGAGLAGIRCARYLEKQGVQNIAIYEASNRLGGRTYTDTTTFEGHAIEHGAAVISTDHRKVIRMASRLGLSLEEVNGGALPEGEELYLIDGEFYTYGEASEDWKRAWRAFRDEEAQAPWPQQFDSFTARGKQLDEISIPEWFDPDHPHANNVLARRFGPDSRFAKFCYTSAIAEWGGEHTAMPALNLLYMLAWNGNSLASTTGSDGRYHIVGGNDQLAKGMAERLSTPVHLDTALLGISGSAAGPYTCHMSDGSCVEADKLVLTLPFNILRGLDICAEIWSGLRPAKQRAINELPMGTNTKVHVGLTHRTWGPGYERSINGHDVQMNGIIYTEPEGLQLGWEETVHAAPGQPLVYGQFLGGIQGANLKGSEPFGRAHRADVRRFLRGAEAFNPGFEASYTGTSLKSDWASAPGYGGAYVHPGIGGYTSYHGSQELQEGNIHFAGEHTCMEYGGYMEGALRSGVRAGQEILADLAG